MTKFYTDEMIEWLRENANGVWYSVLTKKFNEKFNTDISVCAIRSMAKKYNITNNMKNKGCPKQKLFTYEQEEYIRQICKGSTYKKITSDLNEHFNTEFQTHQIHGWMQRTHTTCGHGGYFKKGHVPQNKGKKLSKETYSKMAPTMFKKGHVPNNTRPIGSKRITVDGYVEIKTDNSNKWKLEHRIVWEKTNGKIPPNHILIHLDQNKQNNSLENLKLIPRKISTIVNHIKGWSKDKQITELAVNTAILKKTIIDKKKG